MWYKLMVGSSRLLTSNSTSLDDFLGFMIYELVCHSITTMLPKAYPVSSSLFTKAIKYVFFSIFDTRNGFPISELVGNHIYSFFLSRLGSAVIIGCTRWIIFLGHWHKWVVQRMADLLPNTQPPAPALGMLVNNSETETPSTFTRLSTTDGKCYDSSNRGGKKSVSQKIMDNVSHTPM